MEETRMLNKIKYQIYCHTSKEITEYDPTQVTVPYPANIASIMMFGILFLGGLSFNCVIEIVAFLGSKYLRKQPCTCNCLTLILRGILSAAGCVGLVLLYRLTVRYLF